MNSYVLLLRGVNVGGKNKVSMAALKNCLEAIGFSNVATYIASGNIILKSDKDAKEIKNLVEDALIKNFKLDSEYIKVLVLSHDRLKSVVDNKPKGFGEEPDKYYCDAIFLMDIDDAEALAIFQPKEGVDAVWAGKGVIYSQRLSAMRTKSRLSKIIASPLYKSMTIRSWNTTIKLLEIINKRTQ